MAKSRDWDELTWVWTEWRRKAGKPVRDLYDQLVELTNESANYNSEHTLLKPFKFCFTSHIKIRRHFF